MANFARASEITSKNVIFLINQARAEAGLTLLEENPNLTLSAQEKVVDMFNKGYFAHTSPQGLTPWHWFEKNGYDYEFAGENLAIDFKSAEKQHQVLMNSPTHRKNILGTQFNEIGVAVMKGAFNGKESIITVQQFGSLSRTANSFQGMEKNIQSDEQLGKIERLALLDSTVGIDGGEKNNFSKKTFIFKKEIKKFSNNLWVSYLIFSGAIMVIFFNKAEKLNIYLYQIKQLE